MQYIWKYFLDLNRKRLNNGYGALPITYTEILAYFSLYKIEYDEMEVEILNILDSIAMEYFAEQAEKDLNKTKNKKR